MKFRIKIYIYIKSLIEIDIFIESLIQIHGFFFILEVSDRDLCFYKVCERNYDK